MATVPVTPPQGAEELEAVTVVELCSVPTSTWSRWDQIEAGL